LVENLKERTIWKT